MMMYAIGTAACAFAPNMATLVFFRIIASLGIGGEWAAGAAMVAEVVPEKRRVEAGALLYTAAPLGLFLATIVTYQVQGVYFKGSPETAWRYVFLFGLLPAAVAFLVRLFVKEPERWKKRRRAMPRRPRLARALHAGSIAPSRSADCLMAVVALSPGGAATRSSRSWPPASRPRQRRGCRAVAGDRARRELEADRRQLVQHRRAASARC